MTLLPDVYDGSEEPLYNIGVVARMTGISMATLRAWERRYDYPLSKRTAGGHRLYSEKDVMNLKWVKARVDEGMQTSQAIQALRHQQEAGRLITEPEGVIIREKALEEKTYLPVIREQLIAAVLSHDLSKADLILGEATAFNSPETIILEVIATTMAEVGESWENHNIRVATEHLATNYLRQHMLMWMLNSPPPRPVPPIILACAPNEWHEGSLLILGTILRRRRWPVVYLGQAVPLPDLASLVRDINPSMIVLVAMMEQSATKLVEWAQWLPEVAETGRPIVGYGGRVFTREVEWRSRMPGKFLGETYQQGLENIEQLLR